MTTALDIIERALRSIGAFGSGETLDSATASDALDSLNDVLETWSNENLTVYENTQENFTLTTSASYTIGTGGTLNTTRPMHIGSAFIRSGGIDYPINILTQEEYDSIPQKTVSSSLPDNMVVETSYPLTTIKLYPAPSAAGLSLYINSIKPFTAFSGLTTAVSLPPGYARALRYALAVDLMPEYGVENQRVARLAQTSKKAIKRTNVLPLYLKIDNAIPTRGSRGNIFTG